MKFSNYQKLKFLSNIIFRLLFGVSAIFTVLHFYDYTLLHPLFGVLIILGVFLASFTACEFVRLIFVSFAELSSDIHAIRISSSRNNNTNNNNPN